MRNVFLASIKWKIYNKDIKKHARENKSDTKCCLMGEIVKSAECIISNIRGSLEVEVTSRRNGG